MNIEGTYPSIFAKLAAIDAGPARGLIEAAISAQDEHDALAPERFSLTKQPKDERKARLFFEQRLLALRAVMMTGDREAISLAARSSDSAKDLLALAESVIREALNPVGD